MQEFIVTFDFIDRLLLWIIYALSQRNTLIRVLMGKESEHETTMLSNVYNNGNV